MLYLPLSLGIEGLAAFGDGLDHVQYVVRATGEQRAVVEGMRAVFRASDPDLPTGSVTTLDDLVTASEGERLFEAQLLAVSAAAALALAMIGVYGVSAHAVNDRTREIAVRMALGARGATVTAMVLRQTLMLVLPGLVVGSLASLMATRAIEGSLYGVAAVDPMTYAGVAFLLSAVAWLSLCHFGVRPPSTRPPSFACDGCGAANIAQIELRRLISGCDQFVNNVLPNTG